MKTASWFTELPPDHIMVGISRGVPRNIPPGYRLFRELQPGPWFRKVEPPEYCQRYHAEVLARLDPHDVARRITGLVGERLPVLVCFEHANGKHWCHRSLAAAWLAEALGRPVAEFGFEHLPQNQHPLRPPGGFRARPP